MEKSQKKNTGNSEKNLKQKRSGGNKCDCNNGWFEDEYINPEGKKVRIKTRCLLYEGDKDEQKKISSG